MISLDSLRARPWWGVAVIGTVAVLLHGVAFAGLRLGTPALGFAVVVAMQGFLNGPRWSVVSALSAAVVVASYVPFGTPASTLAASAILLLAIGVGADVFHRRLEAEHAARPLRDRLRHPKRSLRTVIDHFPGLVAYVDRDLRFRLLSRGYAAWYGREVEELEGLLVSDLLHADTYAKMLPRLQRALEGESQCFLRPAEPGIEHPPWRLQTTFVPLRDLDGAVEGIFAFSIDVGERLDAEASLARERERALVTLQSIADGVVTVDAQALVDYMNPVAQSLTGWDANLAQGRPAREVLLVGHEERAEPVENPAERCMLEKAPVAVSGEHVLLSRDGTERAVDVSAAPLICEAGEVRGAVIVIRDVGASRKLTQELAWQAEHDALTGLANRRRFERCVELAIDGARLHGESHAVIQLDLDGLKVVNDTCGHDAGDRLLREVAHLLAGQLRPRDIVARLGGDEFGVLLRDCRVAKAAEIGERLRATLEAHRFGARGKIFPVGASFGVVIVDGEGHSLADVLRAADGGCYLAKEQGRNRVHVASSDDAGLRRRHDQMEWVTRVRTAIDERRLELDAQPIVPLSSGLEPHSEILIRLRDERGERVPPMAWIPAAERYGVMPEIDRWVVRTALADLARRTGERTVYSINLSGTSFADAGFLDFLRLELATRGVDPSRVCFEVTETAAIADLDRARGFMLGLRALGVRFALDDFGSGMSSFAYLKTLPVDYLKIDGGFVRRMATDAVDHAMVEAINHVGHVMGLKTIAEFVEDAATVEKLRRLGVDFAQGHAVGLPQPLGEAEVARSALQPEPFLADVIGEAHARAAAY